MLFSKGKNQANPDKLELKNGMAFRKFKFTPTLRAPNDDELMLKPDQKGIQHNNRIHIHIHTDTNTHSECMAMGMRGNQHARDGNQRYKL